MKHIPMGLKVGDVVKVKTQGPKTAPGPKMTITRIVEGSAWCDWYEGPKLLKERFPLNSLELAEN